jgi:selenocysteine-specific elongation factor
VRGDRYILRRPSPGETLGGGTIVDPHPRRRYKRFAAQTIERLEAISQGTPTDVLLQSLLVVGYAPLKDVIARSNLDSEQAEKAFQELALSGLLINLVKAPSTKPEDYQPKDLIISKGLWEQITAAAMMETSKYHQTYSLRRGIPREELKSRLNKLTRNNTQLFNACLTRMIQQDSLAEVGPFVFLPDHQIQFSPEQQKHIDRLMARFAASPYSPPSLKECQAEIGEEAVNALIGLGDLVTVSSEVAFRKTDYDRMLSEVRQLFQENDTLTVAQVRDHFQSSRRYILAFLEHLDAIGVTARKGDARILKG